MEHLAHRCAQAWELLLELTYVWEIWELSREHHFWLDLETCVRALAGLYLVACTLAVSLRFVWTLLPRRSLPLHWSAIFAFGTWLSTAGFFVLRGLGLFNLPAALVASSALLVLALRYRPEQRPMRWILRRELRGLQRMQRRFVRGPYVLINALFLGFATLFVVRALIIPPLGWDYLTYHGPRAALWVQSGQFSFPPGPSTFSLYRYFFAGAEVLSAWSMLPMHSDLLTNADVVVQWIAMGLGCWALARALRIREPFASTSACVLMFVPTVQLLLNSGYVEFILYAALLNGLALSIHALRKPHGPTLLLAMLSFGVAVGVKLPGAPPAVVMIVACVTRLLLLRERRGQAFAWLGLGLVGALLMVTPWIWFAWRETGHPLSPLPISLFGVKLGVPDPALQWYRYHPELIGGWELEKTAAHNVMLSFGRFFGRESLGVLSLIPLLVCPIGVACLLRRRPLQASLLCVAALLPVIAHFGKSMRVVRIFHADSSSRFLLLSLALAVVVSLSWCRPGDVLSVAYRRLLLVYPLSSAIYYERFGWGNWEHREALLTGVLLFALVTLSLELFRRYGTRVGGPALVALCLLFASWLQMRRDDTRVAAIRDSVMIHFTPRFPAMAEALDDPAKPHHIAVTGGPIQRADMWHTYPLFGRRFQNRLSYVPVTKDGSIAHYGPFEDFERDLDKERWMDRLDAMGIDYVASFPERSREQAWMEELPRHFHKVNGEHAWGLFETPNAL
jgi:hypothetical protein